MGLVSVRTKKSQNEYQQEEMDNMVVGKYMRMNPGRVEFVIHTGEV